MAEIQVFNDEYVVLLEHLKNIGIGGFIREYYDELDITPEPLYQQLKIYLTIEEKLLFVSNKGIFNIFKNKEFRTLVENCKDVKLPVKAKDIMDLIHNMDEYTIELHKQRLMTMTPRSMTYDRPDLDIIDKLICAYNTDMYDVYNNNFMVHMLTIDILNGSQFTLKSCVIARLLLSKYGNIKIGTYEKANIIVV